MHESHIGPDELNSFLLGQLPPQETRDVVRHLLKGCEHCQTLAESVWGTESVSYSGGSERPSNGSTTISLDRVLSRVLDREKQLSNERADAETLREQLAVHPLPRQLMMIRNNPRYQTWGLCEHLIARSWEARFDDVQETTESAEAAVAVAESLGRDRYGEALVNDLRARCWGHLANAHRIRGDYRSAEEAFAIAETALEKGTGDPLDKARLLNFRGSFKRELGRYDEAILLSERLMAIYERSEEHHMLGATLADKAISHAYLDDTETALDLWRRSLEFLDPNVDPRRVLAVQHNLIYELQDHGELDEALALLRETRPLYVQLGDRLNLLRLRRLEGKIAIKLGHTALAEAAFLEARNGFITAGIGVEAAEIALELAAMYLDQGRNRETRQVASQLVPIFQAHDLHQEAAAALLVFQRAAMADAASVELVREILTFFEKSKDEPGLEFRASKPLG